MPVDEMDKGDRASRADRAEFLYIGVVLKQRWQLGENPAQRIAERFDLADTGRIETCFTRVLDVLCAFLHFSERLGQLARAAEYVHLQDQRTHSIVRKRRVRAVENSLDKRRRTRQAHRAAARRDQSEAGVDGRRCFATFQGNSSSMRLAW